MEERALPLRNVSNDFSSFGPEAYPDGVVPPIAADDAASICASRSSSAVRLLLRLGPLRRRRTR